MGQNERESFRLIPSPLHDVIGSAGCKFDTFGDTNLSVSSLKSNIPTVFWLLFWRGCWYSSQKSASFSFLTTLTWVSGQRNSGSAVERSRWTWSLVYFGCLRSIRVRYLICELWNAVILEPSLHCQLNAGFIVCEWIFKRVIVVVYRYHIWTRANV